MPRTSLLMLIAGCAERPHTVPPDVTGRVCEGVGTITAGGALVGSQGLLAEMWSEETGDGIFDWGERYAYDEAGRLIEEFAFLATDPGPFATKRHVYEGDLLVRSETDEDADGTVDRHTAFTHDDFGRVVAWEDVYPDSIALAADGSAASTTIYDYVYDDEGREIHRRIEMDGNELFPESVTTTARSFDDDLLIEELIAWDEGRDGTIDTVIRTTWAWDCTP